MALVPDDELPVAQEAMFSRHPSMANWPPAHRFAMWVARSSSANSPLSPLACGMGSLGHWAGAPYKHGLIHRLCPTCAVSPPPPRTHCPPQPAGRLCELLALPRLT